MNEEIIEKVIDEQTLLKAPGTTGKDLDYYLDAIDSFDDYAYKGSVSYPWHMLKAYMKEIAPLLLECECPPGHDWHDRNALQHVIDVGLAAIPHIQEPQEPGREPFGVSHLIEAGAKMVNDLNACITGSTYDAPLKKIDPEDYETPIAWTACCHDLGKANCAHQFHWSNYKFSFKGHEHASYHIMTDVTWRNRAWGCAEYGLGEWMERSSRYKGTRMDDPWPGTERDSVEAVCVREHKFLQRGVDKITEESVREFLHENIYKSLKYLPKEKRPQQQLEAIFMFYMLNIMDAQGFKNPGHTMCLNQAQKFVSEAMAVFNADNYDKVNNMFGDADLLDYMDPPTPAATVLNSIFKKDE
jgi:hypothetical protein